MLTIKILPTGKWRENCYVISTPDKTTIVIDPGEDAAFIMDYINAEKLNIKAILNTHAHYDHVGAVSDIKDNFAAQFYLHKNDFKLLGQANFYRALFEGQKIIKIPEVDVDLSQSLSLTFGTISVKVIETPGHTAGSVSFLIENNLFVGDTIIARKPGRTDLPGASPEALTLSIAKLLELDDKITVYSGHGKPNTVAEIKQAMGQ